MQGTSTSPARGSHTRPSRFFSAIASAWADCSACPPISATRAAAAMPLAVPTSAWQPPAAPEMTALLAMTRPIAPAQNSAFTTSSSLAPSCSWADSSTPGSTPQEPAVGVAQMRPMAALTSLLETA